MIEHVFYTDGATKNNGKFGEQESHIAVVNDDKTLLIDEPVGDKTNIETEALAIIACLQHIREEHYDHCLLRTDSDFWVKVATGRYRLKKERLFPLRTEIQQLLLETGTLLEWVPREKNYAGHYLEERFEKKWLKPWQVRQQKYQTLEKEQLLKILDDREIEIDKLKKFIKNML
jgi:ribonuclease HI